MPEDNLDRVSLEDNDWKEEISDKLLDEKLEDFLNDESVSVEEFLTLRDKINSLKYQNKINLQRLFTLELEDKKMRKELFKKERILKKH